MPMAKAYSDDLRRKLIEAHQAGEGSLEILARRFHVSVGWTKKVSAPFRRTGSPARPPSGPPGRRGRFGPAIQQQPRQWTGEPANTPGRQGKPAPPPSEPQSTPKPPARRHKVLPLHRNKSSQNPTTLGIPGHPGSGHERYAPSTLTSRSNSSSVVSFGTEQPGARMNFAPAACCAAFH